MKEVSFEVRLGRGARKRDKRREDKLTEEAG